MKLSKRRLPKRRSTKPCLFKPRFEALELRHLLSGSPLPFDDSGLAPAGLQAICALPNLPVFNVQSYGAVGNGVADDTVAIRAALSAAEANGGGIIYLPAGTYDVDPQASDPVAWGAIFTITSSNIVFIGDHDPVTGASETHLKGYVEGLKDPVTNWYVTGDGYSKIGRFAMFRVDSTGADISNVQFRSLDVNGDAPYTGDSEVGGDPTTGDGWDMTNKGIWMDGAHRIDNVLVFNCLVENWRGEEIFSGGNTIGNVSVVDCEIQGSNASAISCSANLLVSNTTIGGNQPGMDVYNGLENFNFSGQSTTIDHCTIMGSALNGLVIAGEVGSSASVTNSIFENNYRGILFAQETYNVVVDGNTFTNNNVAMITSALALGYGDGLTGFGDFTISNNTFTEAGGAFSGGAAFVAQNGVNNFAMSDNTLENGFLFDGAGFGAGAGHWGTFTVDGTVFNGYSQDISHGGMTGLDNIALWTNSIRNNGLYSAGNRIDGASADSVVVLFATDMTVLNTNLSTGTESVAIDPTTLSQYPIGFETTVYAWSQTNWALKADPTWNTFTADVPVTSDGVTIRVNAQGLFELVDSTAKSATTTELTSSESSSTINQALTLTAIVTASTPGANVPTGSVTFYDGSVVLGTGTLDSTGTATWTTSALLVVGSQTFTAVYGGDANFATSSGQTTQTVGPATTTTTALSSASPSILGKLVTFTACVGDSCFLTPTGTVTFRDGSTILGTCTLDSTGKATCSTSALAAGSHSITVSYGGCTNFSASSVQISQMVNRPAKSTSTTLVSSAISPVFGQWVIFTATVGAGGSLVTTGTVTFSDGSIILGTRSLNAAGKAIFSTSTLAAGNHTITATFSGSASFATSLGHRTQAINRAGTRATIVCSPSISAYDQSVTFTASVFAMSPGSGTPTGSVTFLDGSKILGTAALANGRATLSLATLAVGSHEITVSYGRTANFGTTTASTSHTVRRATGSVIVTSSANTSVFGQAVTFTATMHSGGVLPTGTVVFMNGSNILGTGSWDSTGQATFTTAALGAGSHTITISYLATTNFAGGTAWMTQTVSKASTVATLTSSASTSVFGQPVTFTVAVAAVAPGAGIPTGKVTLMDGGTILWTGLLNYAGEATFTASALSVGSHSITVSYAGVANYAASSGLLTQLITTLS